MSRALQPPGEPRSQLIIRRTQQALRTSELTLAAFGTRVAEEYIARVALHERTMDFYVGTTVETAAKADKANGQLVGRIINGTVKFPADLEEAWVAALPAAAQTDLVRELAARYGLLAARLPAADGDACRQMEGFGRLSKEFGRSVQSLASIYADGLCDASDLAHIPGAVAALDETIAAAVSVRAQLLKAAESAR